jgi:predicted HTH domain antitoxin
MERVPWLVVLYLFLVQWSADAEPLSSQENTFQNDVLYQLQHIQHKLAEKDTQIAMLEQRDNVMAAIVSDLQSKNSELEILVNQLQEKDIILEKAVEIYKREQRVLEKTVSHLKEQHVGLKVKVDNSQYKVNKIGNAPIATIKENTFADNPQHEAAILKEQSQDSIGQVNVEANETQSPEHNGYEHVPSAARKSRPQTDNTMQIRTGKMYYIYIH